MSTVLIEESRQKSIEIYSSDAVVVRDKHIKKALTEGIKPDPSRKGARSTNVGVVERKVACRRIFFSRKQMRYLLLLILKYLHLKILKET